MTTDTGDTQTGEEVVVTGGETPPTDTPPAADTDDVVITIGEATPVTEEQEQGAPQWVKDLRKENREKAKRIRELEQAVAARSAPEEITPKAKPTLAGCDYDEEAFEQQLEEWHKQQSQIAEEKRKKEDAQRAEQEAWQATLNRHEAAKAALKVQGYEDAEDAVKTALSTTQLAILYAGCENTAQMSYALGTNPDELKKLAGITDLVKFSFALAKLETKLKVAHRKTPPPPETSVRGTSPSAPSTGDKKLDQLREEAAKTGDMTKVIAYKQQMRAKQAA